MKYLGTKLFNYLRQQSKRDLIIASVCACIAACVLTCSSVAMANMSETASDIALGVPSNYSADDIEYVEDIGDTSFFEEVNWETYVSDPKEEFTTVTVDAALVDASFTEVSKSSFKEISNAVTTNNMSLSDEELITLDENSAWAVISNGIYTKYPEGNFLENKNKLYTIQQQKTQIITVPCWYWEDPNDDANFNKVTTYKSFAVNSGIAQLFEHAFNDIYEDPSQPIINVADKGMGTWVIRGKNHNDYARMSTHSLGCCIDINPSTGSFYVNGKWFGNGYNQNVMSEELWNEMPECHKKYHVLYAGSPIVEIFKSYGFVWGGDWQSTKDPMHLSWIGEGSNTRKTGIENYMKRK